MFVVKPRITLYVCLLIVLLDIVIMHAGLQQKWQHMVCAAIVFAAIVPGLCRRSWTIMAVCLSIASLAWWHLESSAAWSRQVSLLNLCHLEQVCFYGTVSDTMDSPLKRYIVINVRSIHVPFGRPEHGAVLMYASPQCPLVAGCRVVARGRFMAPTPSNHPWDFNESMFLRRMGASAKFVPADYTIIDARPSALSVEAALDDLRLRMAKLHVEALGKRNGTLLTSMVIGNRNVHVEESVSTPFRNLGLSHLLAASGFNLAIVVAASWWLLKPLLRHRLLVNLTAMALMLFYIGLAGLSASIQRSAFMCAAMLTAGAFMRSTYLPAVLALSLASTAMVDPFCLCDVGLQLSYAATTALVCASNKIQKVIHPHHNPVVRFVIDVVLACTAAQASVLPLQLYYFWQAGLLSIPANMLISPVIPLVTIEGFVSSTLACSPYAGFGVLIDRLFGVILVVLMWVVDWLNSFRWAVISTGPPPLWSMVAYYVFLLLALNCKALGWRAAVCVLGLLLAMFALLYRPPLPPLTLVIMRDATIAIDPDRNALIRGSLESPRVRRCLAYFAARPIVSAEGSTAWLQWSEDGTLILRPNRRRFQLNSRDSRHSDRSTVRVISEL